MSAATRLAVYGVVLVVVFVAAYLIAGALVPPEAVDDLVTPPHGDSHAAGSEV